MSYNESRITALNEQIAALLETSKDLRVKSDQDALTRVMTAIESRREEINSLKGE